MSSARGPRTVLEALRPLCLYNGILGLTVFEMPTGRAWHKLSFVYVFIKAIVYFALYWYSRPKPNAVYEHNSNTIVVLYNVTRVTLFINVVIAVFSTVLGFLNHQKVKKFAKRITLADETLEVFGIDPEYKQTWKQIKIIIFVWCIELFLTFASDYSVTYYIRNNALDTFLTVIVFEIPLIQNLTIDLNFAIFVSILGKRFERLNALVQSLTSTPLESEKPSHCKYQNILRKCRNRVVVQPNYYEKNRDNIDFVLKTVRQLHLDLCATARSVNDTFSKQLSMLMASTFLLSTGFGYCTYLVYNDQSASITMKIRYFCSLGIWILTSIFRIIYVVRVTVNVSNESQKTSQLAHEIQVSRFQKNVINEIHQLSLQIMQHPLYFTASGLIALDFGYVRGFVGSVTTYLMILIQNPSDMFKAANTLVEVYSENTTKETTR